MAKQKLADTIRTILLSEAGPDSIPGRVEPKPEYKELGGPIVKNDQAGIDFSEPIKPGQAALPKQGGGGPENNPTKYKDTGDLDPKKVMGEEEDKEDDEKDDLEENRLPNWLKSKLAEATSDDDEEEDDDKEVDEELEERYVKESDDKDEDDEDEDEDEGEKEVNKDYFKKKYDDAKKVSEEAISSLFTGRKISEEFKERLNTVFEAAVETRVSVVEEEMAAHYELAVENTAKKITEQVTGQVDTYLNYVVEQWLEENTLAIERGIRSELTESFINGMKQLFEDHYIDIPEKKVQIVEALAERADELEEKLNSVINENISLKESVKEFQKAEVIRESTKGLTESQASRVRQLAENVEFNDNFSRKLEVLKENSGLQEKDVKKVNLTEDAEFGNTNVDEKVKNSDPLIEQAKQFLGRKQ
jgi:hypothetical protein